MQGIQPKLTKEYLEELVDPVSIFSRYMPLGTEVILDCIHNNSLIISPLRRDNNPTCGFYYDSKSRLRFNDFAGYFHGDCYDLVGYRTFLDSRNPQGFAMIMHHIAKEFKVWCYADSDSDRLLMGNQLLTLDKLPKQYVQIDVQQRDWSGSDLYYWERYGITEPTLDKFLVTPLYAYWVNGQLRYVHENNDPAFGYYNGYSDRHEWQIYHPTRRKVGKFITNSRRLRATSQLKNSEIGVLTKSVKDVMVLYELGINSASLAAESIMPSLEELLTLDKYWKAKISLTDFDKTGITIARKLRKVGFRPLFLTNGRFGSIDFQHKDISDFRYYMGSSRTASLIEYLREEQEVESSDYFLTVSELLR